MILAAGMLAARFQLVIPSPCAIDQARMMT
jgi:hypothetical protein